MRRGAPGRSWANAGFSALELVGVVGVIAAVAGCLFLWGGHATRRAQEASCNSNLKQIGLALAMYADDHAGRLPASHEALPVLTSVYMKNWQILGCPADPHPPTVRIDGVEYGVGYFLVPGLANDDPPATIVAGDTEPRHRGRWNAVYLDGRVRSLPADELAPYRQYAMKGTRDDETQPPGVHSD